VTSASAEVTEVLTAARRLVEAFGAHRREEYFACFAQDATFVFYTTPAVLGSRAEYEAEFDRWERDGFRVLECTSRDQLVQLAGNAAVFSHRVATRAMSGGAEVSSDERETIVFRREGDGRWLAIHEHLSPTPVAGDGA
jgi:ketosteroid isomerase-like protein